MNSIKQTLGVALVAVGMVVTAGCATERGGQPTAARIVDDSVITAKVKTNLIEDQALKAFQINVETYRGDVLLSGFVDSPEMVKRAVEVAKNVEGVKSVRNSLIVKKDEAATGKPSAGAEDKPSNGAGTSR